MCPLVPFLFLGACDGRAGLEHPGQSELAQAGKPEQAFAPGEETALEPAHPMPKTEGVPVPAEVKEGPSTYEQEGEKPEGLSIPPFEIPSAGAKQRGRGVFGGDEAVPAPGQATGAVPLSWTGSSGSFESTDFDVNGTYTGGYRFIPPDPHVAVGPDHVVGVVNVTISFHTKDGTLDLRDDLKGFFAGLGATNAPATFTFDPKVIFDQYEQRFVVVTLEQTATAAGDSADTSRIYVAVSDDEDPNGTWYLTMIDSKINISGTATWADYPGLAVDDQAVYITANMFSFPGSFQGNRLWILDKGVAGGLYDGGTASVSVHNPVPGGFFASTQQPAHVYGDSGPFGANGGTFLVLYSGLSGGGNESVQVVSVTDPLGTPTFTGQFVGVGNIDNTSLALTDADQSGTATDIEVNDRRTLNAVWRYDSLWLATTIRAVSASDNDHTTAHWIRLDTTGPTIAVAEQGNIGGEDIATGTYTFFPSVMVNENEEAVVGFSASDDSIYAGAYFVTREASDAAGTTGAAQTVKAGVDYYVRTFGGSRNRWGDYSGASVDPTNGCFWLYNEWAMSRGTTIGAEDGRWSTWLTETCSCAPADVALPRDQWVMLGLGCGLGQDGAYDTVADLFPTLSTTDYNTTWVLYERDAASETYVKKAVTDPVEEGTGYWFYTTEAGVNLAQKGMKNRGADIPLVADSAGRMNLVATPRSFAVDWADVRVVDGGSTLTLNQADPDIDNGQLACDQANPRAAGCIMARQMYQWNGAAYQVYDGQTQGMEGVVYTFDGLWVEAFKPGIKLRFPELVLPSGAPLAASSVTRLGQAEADVAPTPAAKVKLRLRKKDGWYARLIVESDELVDPGNVFGQVKGARKGRDMHDLEEPPPFGKRYLTLVFLPDWADQQTYGYASDYRAPSDRRPEWRVVVRGSDDLGQIELRWEGPVNRLARLRVLDEETGEELRMRAAQSYPFSLTGGEHRFRIFSK